MTAASTRVRTVGEETGPDGRSEQDVRPRPTDLKLVDGDVAPEGEGIIAFWSRGEIGPGEYSIPDLVDRDAVALRRQYLEWVYQLGCAPVADTDLKHALLFEGQSVSYWWLTRIAQKSPMRTPAIYDVLKVRALELLYQRLGCRGLQYSGGDEQLARTLEDWCQAIGHPYRRILVDRKKTSEALASRPERILHRLPHAAQGIVFLAWSWWQRYRHRRRRQIPAADGVTIVTYFPNYDQPAARRDRFRSRYLGRLHDLLDELPYRLNWVWLYSESDHVSYQDAAKIKEKFNRAAIDRERFSLLEDFISSWDLLRALSLFLRLWIRSRALKPVKEHFRFAASDVNFFPLLEYDWRASVSGTTAMEAVLHGIAFDRMAQALPTQPWGLFVWEGHGWESALVGAWRRFQKGRIIGYQHSALRPMDLRSYEDSRVLDGSGPADRPIPDFVAVNGDGSMELMLETGWPPDRLRKVEATRYAHLSASTPSRNATADILLVLTGFMAADVRYQLRLLDRVPNIGEIYSEVWVKPHPYRRVDSFLAELQNAGGWKIVHDPLEELLPDVRCAFAASSTAAVIEALYAGVPVVVCAPSEGLNLSPVFGMPDVPVVGDEGALACTLADPPAPKLMGDYLNLGTDLPAWEQVLA